MDDLNRFLKIKRQKSLYRSARERIKDYKEVSLPRDNEKSQEQASRCMDCGTSFCHWGCPIGNYIPDWNNLLFTGHWQKAADLLSATNNLPEITGRLCPALCEYACVLGVTDDPVTIRENELAIIEHAFKMGYIKPVIPAKRTGKKTAVIGSGPAGLSCADQLNKAGHKVVVFEKDDKLGGILRYGIPDFKLEKWVIDRRAGILRKEGIDFVTSMEVGKDYPSVKLKQEFDAVCLAGGCRVPRDLKIEGRDLKGIHFAMDYLIQSNRRVAGENIPASQLIDAKNKRVVVIGGGDTGADCVGTAHRQGAAGVFQIEVLPKPSPSRTEDIPWPKYPLLLKVSTSHEEGGTREWAVITKKFSGENGILKKIICAKVDFSQKDEQGRFLMKEIPGSEFEIDTDLAILAIGFLHPEHKGVIDELGVKLDPKGNVQSDDKYMVSRKGIFSAGDMRRGQSLITWAVSEGRKAAFYIDLYLMGESQLPLI